VFIHTLILTILMVLFIIVYKAHIRDPSGAVHTVKSWKLRLLEMSAPHPPQHVINKLLHEVVARTQPVNTDPSSYSPEYQAKGMILQFKIIIGVGYMYLTNL
jgi:hypothetical protein